ncbi:molybdopterin-guanine dinucleotide biosynthesis protein B [Pseudogemmobacter sonorensis]|uniref:molybdopterin-guanine dinucleotide biosynthesis protein B n=1 Tax=Pseudogemmobacter sonorensis TaxID=2989681 RepID=UPI00368F454E
MRIYGITGRKNSGKTTLVERLVAEFAARGLRVSTIKHSHHAAGLDRPGTDSDRHRAAGAIEVVLAAPNGWALMGGAEPGLEAHLARLAPVDLVLVEGFKTAPHAKIETIRRGAAEPPLAPGLGSIRALASDHPFDLPDLSRPGLPRFDLDDIPAIADFIAAETGLIPPPPPRGPGRDAPVEEVLARLRARIRPITTRLTLPLEEAAGHILAEEARAARSHPPMSNSALDGYGYAFATLDPAAGPVPLAPGRAAPGVPYPGTVPPGHALRILTGAALPEGVDTVIAQERTRMAHGGIELADPPARPGANIRPAAEDVRRGAPILAPGQRLGPAEIGLAAATGLTHLVVRPRLRVGVLSTGAELALDHAAPGVIPGAIPDANRPMLIAALTRLGHAALDLGILDDDRDAIRDALDRAAGLADAIVTSGGASGGDEDHVSALLRAEGELSSWRVAMKPGRPLALAHWKGVPVFGLPGNPVAAMTCAMVFAAPALALRAGAGWRPPRGHPVIAGFSRDKPAGRREYLRARLNEHGLAEVFPSEGSARISSLAWADGLIELPEDLQRIRPGDRLHYIPWSGFGL